MHAWGVSMEESVNHLVGMRPGVAARRLYAWEEAFKARITQVRAAELVHVRRMGLWQAANRNTFNAVSNDTRV